MEPALHPVQPRHLKHPSPSSYDRQVMADNVHPLYPDRDPQGRFINGHPKLGGARGGRAMPRNWPRKITRLLSRLERGRDRTGHIMHHLRVTGRLGERTS